MQLFDGHVATIKVIIKEINVNCFLVKKISKTISSHLNIELGETLNYDFLIETHVQSF